MTTRLVYSLACEQCHCGWTVYSDQARTCGGCGNEARVTGSFYEQDFKAR